MSGRKSKILTLKWCRWTESKKVLEGMSWTVRQMSQINGGMKVKCLVFDGMNCRTKGKGLVACLIVFPCLHASLPIKCSFQLAKNGDLNKESLTPSPGSIMIAIASAHHSGLDFNSNRANGDAKLSRCCPTWHPKPFRPQSCHNDNG